MVFREEKYRTAIYCSYYESNGDKQTNSIKNQLSYCKKFVSSQKNLILTCDPFCDTDISEDSKEGYIRSEFHKLVSLVENRGIDCIVCQDLARLSKDIEKCREYLNQFALTHGIRLIAINNCDTKMDNPQKIEYFLPYLMEIDSNFTRDTSVKIRSILKMKYDKTSIYDDFCCFGYKQCEKNPYKLLIVDEEAKIVQDIFYLYQNLKSVQDMVYRLNAQGVLVPLEYKKRRIQGKKGKFTSYWENNLVKNILTNEIYTGITNIFHNSERVTMENSHEPLVPATMFHSVQKILNSDHTFTSHQLLISKIFCADCGGRMKKKVVVASGYSYNYYICSNHYHKKNCSTHSIYCEEVEFQVLQEAEKILNALGNLMDRTDSEEQSQQKIICQERLKSIDVIINRLKGLRLILFDELTSKIINKGEYQLYCSEYTENIAIYTKKKEKIEKMFALYQLYDLQKLDNILQHCQVIDTLEGIENLEKDLISKLIAKVLIHEERKVEVILNNNGSLEETGFPITLRSKYNKIITI